MLIRLAPRGLPLDLHWFDAWRMTKALTTWTQSSQSLGSGCEGRFDFHHQGG